MLPHLESLSVPLDVEEAAEAVFMEHPHLLGAIGANVAPIAHALGSTPLPVPMPEVVFDGSDLEAHRRAARRTPLYAAHLARWARRTLVPAFCAITPSGAPLPLADETLAVLREQLQAAVVAEPLPFGGDLPTCEDLLVEAPPDAVDWPRVVSAILTDAEAERALHWSGAEAAFSALDQTRTELVMLNGDAPRIVGEFMDEFLDAVSIGYDIAWLIAHLETWRVIHPALQTAGHRARATGELRSVATQTLGEAVLPSALDLIGHVAAFVADAVEGPTRRGA
jgi:hypothetical protein